MMSWQLGRNRLLQYNYVEYCDYYVSHDNQSNHYVHYNYNHQYIFPHSIWFASVLCGIMNFISMACPPFFLFMKMYI